MITKGLCRSLAVGRGGGAGWGGGGGGRMGWPAVSKGYGMKHLLGSGSHIFHNLPGLMSNNRCGKTGVREEDVTIQVS